jgi:hypothetical protein
MAFGFWNGICVGILLLQEEFINIFFIVNLCLYNLLGCSYFYD